MEKNNIPDGSRGLQMHSMYEDSSIFAGVEESCEDRAGKTGWDQIFECSCLPDKGNPFIPQTLCTSWEKWNAGKNSASILDSNYSRWKQETCLRTLEEVSGECLIYQIHRETEDLFLFNYARKRLQGRGQLHRKTLCTPWTMLEQCQCCLSTWLLDPSDRQSKEHICRMQMLPSSITGTSRFRELMLGVRGGGTEQRGGQRGWLTSS